MERRGQRTRPTGAPTRRAALVALGAVALTGCTGLRPSAPGTPPPEPDPEASTRADTGSDRSAGSDTTPDDPAAPSAVPRLSREATIQAFADRTPSGWGLHLPGIVDRSPSSLVALTFDACGGSGGNSVDRDLLELLVAEEVPATLFLNARWLRANPDQMDALAARPDLFELANHGTRHVPLSVTGRAAYGIGGTAGAGEVWDEVVENHELLTEVRGAPPRWFRSGTAHYDDVAVDIVRSLGEIPVGFDVNADAGATLGPHEVESALAAARAGSIVLAHLNRPSGGTAEGLAAALPGLRARGLGFGRLADVLPT